MKSPEELASDRLWEEDPIGFIALDQVQRQVACNAMSRQSAFASLALWFDIEYIDSNQYVDSVVEPEAPDAAA